MQYKFEDKNIDLMCVVEPDGFGSTDTFELGKLKEAGLEVKYNTSCRVCETLVKTTFFLQLDQLDYINFLVTSVNCSKCQSWSYKRIQYKITKE